MMKKQFKHKKLLKYLIWSVMAYVMLTAIALIFITAVNRPSVSSDPLVAYADLLGIDHSHITMTYVKQFHVPGDLDLSKAGSYFDYGTNDLEVKIGLTPYQQLNAVAYEYMHYIWYNLSPAEQASRSQYLTNLASQNPNLSQAVSVFHGNQAMLSDEMNSIVCTRINPAQVSAEYNSFCDHYLPHRALLFAQ